MCLVDLDILARFGYRMHGPSFRCVFRFILSVFSLNSMAFYISFLYYVPSFFTVSSHEHIFSLSTLSIVYSIILIQRSAGHAWIE